MKLRHPLALLLSSAVSFAGVGCAALDAVVHSPSPTSDTTTDRLVAIGRVFENQGQYDRAEVLYRRALKANPGDTAVRDQVARLVARREGRSFGPSGSQAAIAAADQLKTLQRAQQHAAGQSTARAGEVPPPATAPAVTTQPAQLRQPTASLTAPVRNEQQAVEMVDVTFSPDTEIRSGEAPVAAVRQASTDSGSDEYCITADAVLEACAESGDHNQLLLKALRHGDCVETQAIAAALLGEAPGDDIEIETALDEVIRTTEEPLLLLSIADSQIQRSSFNGATAAALQRVAMTSDTELRIQAITALHHFAGAEADAPCVAVLRDLLHDDTETVRSAAAMSLGDFTTGRTDNVAILTAVAAEDASAEVRQAASLAISRYSAAATDHVAPIVIQPR